MKNMLIAVFVAAASLLLGCDCDKCKECSKAADCSKAAECANCSECAKCSECAACATCEGGHGGTAPGAPVGVPYALCPGQLNSECVAQWPPPGNVFDTTCSKSTGVCLNGVCRAVLQPGKMCHKGSQTPCIKGAGGMTGTAQCIASGADMCGWAPCN
jgi:hypothetical protein